MSSVISARQAQHRPHPAPVAPLRVAIEDAFDFGSADFSRLFENSSATAFQHPVWLQAFYRHWAPARGARAVIVTGRCAAGHLRFVLPLILRRLSAVALLESADLGVSDYAAPIVDRTWWDAMDEKGGVAEAVVGQLPHYDVLRLKPVRPEHLELWRAFLPGTSRRLGFSAHATMVEGPMDAWRARALDSGFARMVARKRKRLFRSPGARLQVLDEPSAIAAALTRMVQWRKGRFSGDVIQDPAAQAFYRSVASAGVSDGFARTYALEIEEGPLGYAFAIAAGGRLNYLLVGCDYARHGRHSPGLLLYDGMIEDWIGQDGDVFDFTIGDEPFKADFGTSPTPMSEITHTASWRGAMALAALRLRERWRSGDAVAPVGPTPSEVKE